MNSIQQIENQLTDLFIEWYGTSPNSILQLPNSGSNRIYYRLKKEMTSAIGVYNANYKENVAFIDFTKQLGNARINVPQIYSEKLADDIYLIQDLGDQQLLSWLISIKKGYSFPQEAIVIYKQVIQQLVQMQIIAGRHFDYSKCHQHSVFNKDAILFDLNYFKENYLDTLAITYDDAKLQTDFSVFANYLLQAENNYFMFRDFQARNIILKENQPFFIDYQGGRRGPLQYDLVSLLFQAKAEIPEKIKIQLVEYYIKIAKLYVPLNKDEFLGHYYAFALIRVLQTLGAYGLRGLKEKKRHFIESIPLAKNNLVYLNDNVLILNQLNTLKQIISQVIETEIRNGI